MPSTTNEVTALLDQAVGLLLEPTLVRLQAVEGLLRQAVAGMPPAPSPELGRKVRLCSLLLDNAEACRLGGQPARLYSPAGTLNEAGPPRRVLAQA